MSHPQIHVQCSPSLRHSVSAVVGFSFKMSVHIPHSVDFLYLPVPLLTLPNAPCLNTYCTDITMILHGIFTMLVELKLVVG